METKQSSHQIDASLSGEALLAARSKPSALVRLGRLAKHKPLGTASAAVIALMVVAAIFASQISPYSPLAPSPRERLQGPSVKHWFGTDNLGRDLLSRIIHGSRVSLLVALPATALGVGVGSLLGLVSGYLGGAVDLVIQRLMDAQQSIPTLLLALALIAVLGSGMDKVILVIIIIAIPWNGRVVRGAVLSIKEQQYVEGARAIGAGSMRIMFRHVLPNVMAPIVILFSLLLGAAIIIEASLSFLGLGVPPPTPSWGGMLTGDGRKYMEQVPTMALFPGLALGLVVLAFNLLGDTLRDIWDPRLRGTQ